MTAKIIDGNAVARTIRNECRQGVQHIVGSDPASRIYVKNKIRACANVGIRSFRFDYPSDVGQDEVVGKIAELNADGRLVGDIDFAGERWLQHLSISAAKERLGAGRRPVMDRGPRRTAKAF